MLQLDAFLPSSRNPCCEHGLQIAMTLSSSATKENFQTGEDMFTNDDVMSETQAESHCNLKQVICSRKVDESQINQTD